MYQSPIVAHGFNHQSFYRQPVSNLRQINDVVWNRKNENQSIGSLLPLTYPTNTNQQYFSGYANDGNKFYPTFKDPNEVKMQSNKTGGNRQENSLSQLPQTTMTGYAPVRSARPTNTIPGTIQDRLLIRQASVGAIPEGKHASSREVAPLSNSRSAGAVQDYIQNERKAHTMAPLARITGPSKNITTSMFATPTAPSDAHAIKSSYESQTRANASIHPQSNTEMIDGIDNSYEVTINENGEANDAEEEEEADDDDDAPIIVKVQYDPDTGGPPSEDIVRQALDNQLKGQSRSRNVNDPIVLNFLKQPTQPETSSTRSRPQQPFFNRSAPSIPEFISRTQQQQQQRQQSSQQWQHQQQLIFQQQLKQQQQQLQLQERQRQQQQLQLQEKQRQQLQLQERQRQQQQKQEQEQQRRQQEFVIQQQKQKLQQYQQRQQQLQQQRKEEQIRRERLKWEQEQQQLQKQWKKEEQEIQQLIKEHLHKEQQELQHERQQRLLREQQQQRQKQQELQQRNRQIYQQQQNGSLQPNASLPPMGPRPSRTVPAIRAIPMNKPPANNHNYPIQTVSQAPLALRRPSQFPTITIQKLTNPTTNTTLNSDPLSPGLNAYNGYSRHQIPNIFIPIQLAESANQPYGSLNSTNTAHISQGLLQRPHTAPSGAEMFRPSSALDTPELSQENLRNMLERIPDLSGRRFSIQYTGPAEPVSYPIPSPLDDAYAKYPEAVIVDQLPTNIIRHVRSSDNIELKTALNMYTPAKKPSQPHTKSYGVSTKLNQASSKVAHHAAGLRHRVKRTPSPIESASSDDYDSSTETFTSEDTEIEEIEIEIVPLSKYQNES